MAGLFLAAGEIRLALQAAPLRALVASGPPETFALAVQVPLSIQIALLLLAAWTFEIRLLVAQVS